MPVVSINENLETFNQSLKIFKVDQNFNTLKTVILSGIESGADLSKITFEIDNLLFSDDAIFWSTQASKDYWLLELLEGFWDLLSKINTGPALDDKFIANLEKNPTDLPERKQKQKSDYSKIEDQISPEQLQSLKDITQIEQKRDLSIRNLIDVTRQKKCRFFPQPYLLMKSESEQDVLKHIKNAEDLSYYFEQYFCSQTSYENIAVNKLNKVSLRNKEEILKIFAALTYARFLKKYCKFANYGSINEFLTARSNKSCVTETINHGRQGAELTIISINLIMACQILGVDGKEVGLFSHKELSNSFWRNFLDTAELLDRIIVLLPLSAAKTLVEWCEWGTYSLSPDLLSQISISNENNHSNDDLKRVIEKMFIPKGSGTDFFERFSAFAYENTCGWKFDMEFMHHVNASTLFYLSDVESFPHVERSLSDALARSDQINKKTGHLMPIEWIDEFPHDARYIQYSSRSHPALHGLHFCADPFSSCPFRWMKLAESFINFGNPFYATTIMSLFLECRLRLEIILGDEIAPVDLTALKNILDRLLQFPSFQIIQQSIKHYLDNSDRADVMKGCIAAFCENPVFQRNELKVVSFTEEWINANFTPISFDFSPLNKRAAKHFEKAIQLIENKNFMDAGLSNYAFIEVAKGLEAELKDRLKSLGEADIKEFENRGLKTLQGRNVFNLPLGGLLKILREARYISRNIQNKIPFIMTLLQAEDFERFLDTSYSILERRNWNSHSPNPEEEMDPQDIKMQLLKSKKEMLEEGFLETLCETAF